MKTFKINDRIEIECEYKKARDGFNHVAVLIVNGNTVDKVRVHYINRTWESYKFQSVMERLIEKTKVLTKDEKDMAIEYIKNYKKEGAFNTLLAITKIGDILCDTQKEKNDWKQRMMKASLGEGVNFPDDWNGLPEEEKTRRLNGALDMLK